MVSHSGHMSSRSTTLPSLRRYLLTWFAGCAIVMVFAYTQLLEYYLDLGIDLRTQSFLERTALQYSQSQSNTPELPSDRHLKGYNNLTDIPITVLNRFSLDDLQHGEVQRFVNLDFEDDEEFPDGKRYRVDTFSLCGENPCELLFLYPYRLRDGQWLYLLHGIVGSEEDFEELEITEQVAFGIGSLFAVLLILVSFFVVRSLLAPLEKLETWSGQLGTDEQADVPNLRFNEYDTLAQRLQSAFTSVRDGVLREKLFLRHASHELRTPIAILSSNLELMDRLTDRPERTDRESAALVRQYRAIEDVQLLIETLLWINRQSDQIPSSEDVDLNVEIDSIVEHYHYLIENDGVDLTLKGEVAVLTAPVAAVRIVLSNLVRNAFQFTKEGQVRISVMPNQVIVENVCTANLQADENDDYGFGLGLQLVTMLCNRLNWTCSHKEITGGRRTTLDF